MTGTHKPFASLIQSKQFELAKAEFQKLDKMMTQLSNSLELADALMSADAHHWLQHARDHFEEGGYWLDKVIKTAAAEARK